MGGGGLQAHTEEAAKQATEAGFKLLQTRPLHLLSQATQGGLA